VYRFIKTKQQNKTENSQDAPLKPGPDPTNEITA